MLIIYIFGFRAIGSPDGDQELTHSLCSGVRGNDTTNGKSRKTGIIKPKYEVIMGK